MGRVSPIIGWISLGFPKYGSIYLYLNIYIYINTHVYIHIYIYIEYTWRVWHRPKAVYLMNQAKFHWYPAGLAINVPLKHHKKKKLHETIILG